MTVSGKIIEAVQAIDGSMKEPQENLLNSALETSGRDKMNWDTALDAGVRSTNGCELVPKLETKKGLSTETHNLPCSVLAVDSTDF
jgi:hypothetical protein